MRSTLLFGFLSFLLLVPVSLQAADLDLDALDDQVISPPDTPGGGRQVTVAIVDTGDGAVNDYGTRLTNTGYAYDLIPMNSGYATLIQYEAVILPTSHGSTCCYGTFESLAGDYHSYVSDGGCLYVGQPNPFDHPGGNAAIPWVPYVLELNAFYDGNDCPPVIVDPDDCVTEGMVGDDFPFPGDTVLELGPEWNTLVQGPSGRESVFDASYGAGHVLVELGHPSPNALCPYSDAGFARMIGCCIGGPTAVETIRIGGLKLLYR